MHGKGAPKAGSWREMRPLQTTTTGPVRWTIWRVRSPLARTVGRHWCWGTEPATSCYLPERRAFLRWLAADSEAGLKAAAEAVLAHPATEWEECGTWASDGPAVLMDSAEAGSELDIEYPGGGMPDQAPVSLPMRPLESPGHPHQGRRGKLGRPRPAPAHRVSNGQLL